MSELDHEIQRQMLQRLKLTWPDGEPFYAIIEDEIVRLRTTLETASALVMHTDPDLASALLKRVLP